MRFRGISRKGETGGLLSSPFHAAPPVPSTSRLPHVPSSRAPPPPLHAMCRRRRSNKGRCCRLDHRAARAATLDLLVCWGCSLWSVRSAASSVAALQARLGLEPCGSQLHVGNRSKNAQFHAMMVNQVSRSYGLFQSTSGNKVHPQWQIQSFVQKVQADGRIGNSLTIALDWS